MSIYTFTGIRDLGTFKIEAEDLTDAIETLDFEMQLHDNWEVKKSELSNKVLILFNEVVYDVMEVTKNDSI